MGAHSGSASGLAGCGCGELADAEAALLRERAARRAEAEAAAAAGCAAVEAATDVASAIKEALAS